MTENTDNTLSAYLGPEFQQRLIWQLLVEPEFAEKIIPDLAIEYFDDPNIRRLFVIILEYFKEFEKVPNLQNQSIHQAINNYKTPNNIIEEESLFAVLKRIELWNERIINKQMLYDGDVVQKSAHIFIKQQEYRKIAEHIQGKVKNGEIKNKYEIAAIEDKFQKIAHIGEEEDGAISVGDGLRKALQPEFRQTIPTGIETIDVLTDGGLGKGEIGVVLTPSGVGKTTFLTRVANTAFGLEKNVAQIIFEDTDAQIQRKHSVIWADSSLTAIKHDKEEIERVYQTSKSKCEYLEGRGRLIIKRFSQEDTTMRDIRNWMVSYEKKWGFKFDILVLDYLDCVESHKRGQQRTEAELTVIKGFETLAADFDIPAWTAIQTNRSGFDAEFVDAQQTGGSIKRIQKAHFFMSVAKTPAQKEAHFANIRIIKARFAQDGQEFRDCLFNNDTMKIKIDDDRYRYSPTYKGLKHHDENDVSRLEKTAENLMDKSSDMTFHANISKHNEGTLVDKLNKENINDLLHDNKRLEINDDLKPQTDFHPEAEHHDKEAGEADKTKLKNIDSYHINTTRTDLSEEEKEKETIGTTVVENIENIPVRTQYNGLIGVDDGVSDGVSDAPKVDVTQLVSPGISIVDPPEVVKSTLSDAELLERILEIDPDAPQGEDEELKNMLVKKRNYQSIKKNP